MVSSILLSMMSLILRFPSKISLSKIRVGDILAFSQDSGAFDCWMLLKWSSLVKSVHSHSDHFGAEKGRFVVKQKTLRDYLLYLDYSNTAVEAALSKCEDPELLVLVYWSDNFQSACPARSVLMHLKWKELLTLGTLPDSESPVLEHLQYLVFVVAHVWKGF